VRRPHAVLLAVLLLVLVPAAAAQAGAQAPPPIADPATAFDGDGMWIWQVEETEGGDLDRIAARARSAGLTFVVVKAAHGTRWWSQFDRRLVDTLHAAGVRVCAYQRALSKAPGAEARTLARAVGAGADCLVIDAEAEYERRHAQARTYVRALRDAVGDAFPVGLTSFPFVDVHRGFPYEVFLGPRGAQVNLPQMYWGLIGTTIGQTFARTWEANAAFGRPIRPIGQLFGGVRPAAIRAFRAQAAAHGSAGISWWAWQHARPQDWREVRSGQPAAAPSRARRIRGIAER
jgi:hypothetical protein